VRWSFRRSRNDRRSFDEVIFEVLEEGILQALQRGLDEDAAAALAGNALNAAVEEAATGLADALIESGPRMLRDRRKEAARFERRLAGRWGAGLDLFYYVLTAAEEMGSGYNERARDAIERGGDTASEVLTGLHARACRVAREVHHLLIGGYGMGGLARCRTLHELAVTAAVISKFSREPAHSDLAQRFLAHTAVTVYLDAVSFQENCVTLGYEPYSDAEMDEFKKRYDAAMQTYGPVFKKDYGWAATLDPNPNFRTLEKLAQVSHLRSHYRWASHEVHSDAKGWALNRNTRGKVTYMATGPMNTGLADPGHLALISLLQCTTATLMNNPDLVSPQDMLGLGALMKMIDRAGERLGESQQAVDAAEARYQRRAESRAWRLVFRIPIPRAWLG